MPLHAIRWWS